MNSIIPPHIVQKVFLDQNPKLWKRTSIYRTQIFKTSLILTQNDQIFLPINELHFMLLNMLYLQEKEEVTNEALSAILIYRNGLHTTLKFLSVSAVSTTTVPLVLES
jgi:hypothetical protein